MTQEKEKFDVEDEDTKNFKKTITTLSCKINDCENKIKENWDLYVRERAEIENIKKRTTKEVLNTSKYAIRNIIKDLLSVIDSLEQYLKTQKSIDNNGHKGIKLIYKIFLNTLEKHGIKKILIQENTILDPEKHEVISIVKSDCNINYKIMDVLQNGYILHDQVLRYAKVTISKDK